MGNLPAAEQLLARKPSTAAAFHVGRVHEAQGSWEAAVKCYTAAQQHAHGARLALQ
jgi:hypothetical protein